MSASAFRSRLLAGTPVFVTTLDFPDPSAAEFLSELGVDAVAVDTEHTAVTGPQIVELARACKAGGGALVVKTNADPDSIGKYLDAGVAALQIAHVKSRQDVDDVVTACQFAPDGHRGLGRCRNSRFGHYAGGYAQLIKDSHDSVALIVHIESMEAVAVLDDILAAESIDAIFVGAFDLSASLGIPGEVLDERVQDVIRDIVTRSRAAGKAVGMSASTPEQTTTAIERGATLLLSAQSRLMSNAVSQLRSAPALTGASS
ncbi:HpcH/HpaI aldolase/citrate lyase family protein [Pseudarthrobacter sp. NPDC058329]|uniref:HpcH/HpaI aldolase family protein n=1 Tax=Pseudarthrobacter sp. NPDC058329 TaxID=3346448 RepID=UPI0036D9EE13